MFKKVAAHLKTGQHGEQLARHYLERHGLKIIANNVRTRYGEIDLIASDSGTLVFIEVRTRKATAAVSPAESITAGKRQKWWRSAQSYLQQHYRQLPPCRFDAMCIHLSAKGQANIEWLQNVMGI